MYKMNEKSQNIWLSDEWRSFVYGTSASAEQPVTHLSIKDTL